MDDAMKATPEGKEIDRIYNDDTHPMHAKFVAGDREVSEHVSRLYEQAYTGASSAPPPEVDSAKAEIEKIYAGEHELSEKYLAGDPEAQAKVSELYREAHGGNSGESQEMPVEILRENVARVVGMDPASAEFEQAFKNVSTLQDRFPEGEERNAFLQVAAAVEEAVGNDMALHIAFKLFGK